MISDFVLLPAVLALYLALRRIDRGVMLIATAFFLVYVFLDLAVTGLDFAGLIIVSEDYAANSAATQPPDIVVAIYLHSVISISQPISSGALSVGTLLSSFVLRHGAFGKAAVYLGTASGVVGLAYAVSAALTGLAGLLGLSAILQLLWFAVIGVCLYRSE